jgi:hypothetical protein
VLEPDDALLLFEKPGAFLAADCKLRDLRRLHRYRRSSISSITLDATVAKVREGQLAKSHRRRKQRRNRNPQPAE